MTDRRREFGRRRDDQTVRRSRQKVLVVAIVATLGLFLTYTQACNPGGESESVVGPTATTVAPGAAPAGAPAADPATPANINIKVRNNGEVINNTGNTLTACLFNRPYGEGVLVDEWKAKPGSTQSSYQVPYCAPMIGQIEITDAGSCPTNPHGFIGLAANPNVTIPGTEELCCVAPEEVTIECADLGIASFCKATSSVPSNFKWDPEYQAELEESTGQKHCEVKSYESFWNFEKTGRHWEDLDYVAVRAFNCECPESGTEAVWYRDDR